MGTIGAVSYGIHRYRTKGPTANTSVFAVQLRVLAQGVIVTSLFLGMLNHFYDEHFAKKETQLKKDWLSWDLVVNSKKKNINIPTQHLNLQQYSNISVTLAKIMAILMKFYVLW